MSAAADGIDAQRLDRFLKSRLDGLEGPLVLTRIDGGQSNPTFFADYGNQRLVLRKRPAGVAAGPAHAVDREYRIMAALAASGVPVPRVRLLHMDEDVMGTPFYLMDRVDGRVFADCSLPGVSAADRRAMYLDMARVLAALHAVDWQARGLDDFGRTGNYFARQLASLSRQLARHDAPAAPPLHALQQWLAANVPGDGPATIVHGDFRIGNLMFHPHEPRVVAVLDWELSTLGHPMADLAYSALAWRLDADEYMGMRDRDPAGLGIPGESDYVAHYARASPRGEALRPFHFAFSLYRLSVIFAGIGQRSREGTAAGANAGKLLHLSERFAQAGLRAVRS